MDENNQSNFTDDEIISLLKESLREKLEPKKYKNKAQLKDSLCVSMQEFMSSFKVVGYDVDGNLVSFTYAPNDVSKHAIIHAYLDEFARLVGNKM